MLAVARRAGLHTSKRLGQHFLIDRGVLETVIDALAPDAADTIIEVGCGIGTLTSELAVRAARVIAVDVDAACIRAATITQRPHPNVELVRADARHLDPPSFGVDEWLAAGNLPYRLTGVLLSRMFELPRPPERGVFLVQREVAARLSASGEEWSLATLAIRSIATVERLRDIPPGAFLPPPAVHSSVIRLRPLVPAVASRPRMLALARSVFQQRRKTLRHALRHAVGDDATSRAALETAGVEAARRPGTLGLDEWARLADAVNALQGRST